MRYLGIDYGTKRIGIALSDEKGKMAFAYGVILNTGKKEVVEKIKKICAENSVGKIVLGKSLNYKGESNPIMKKIEPFKTALEKETGLPVIYENEGMTTMEAERVLKGERARPSIQSERKSTEKFLKMRRKLDASAAALILKSYLDKIC